MDMVLRISVPAVEEYWTDVDDTDEWCEIVDRYVGETWRRAAERFRTMAPSELETSINSVRKRLATGEEALVRVENRQSWLRVLRDFYNGYRQNSQAFVVETTIMGSWAPETYREETRFSVSWGSPAPQDPGGRLAVVALLGSDPGSFEDPVEGPVQVSLWLDRWAEVIRNDLDLSGPSDSGCVLDQAREYLSDREFEVGDKAARARTDLGLLCAVYELKTSATTDISLDKHPFDRVEEVDVGGRRAARRIQLLQKNREFVVAYAARIIRRRGVNAKDAYEELLKEVDGRGTGAHLPFSETKRLTEAMGRGIGGLPKMTATAARDDGDKLAAYLDRKARRYLPSVSG